MVTQLVADAWPVPLCKSADLWVLEAYVELRAIWDWGLWQRWKHLLQFTLRVIMCPCAVLSVKANMCALGLYDYVVYSGKIPETADTLVVCSCGGFWRLSCPCAVLSVKANMCALGLHGSEGYHVVLHLILCYNFVVSPLHYSRTLLMIPEKIPETLDNSGTYRKHSGHSCGGVWYHVSLCCVKRKSEHVRMVSLFILSIPLLFHSTVPI